VPRSPAPFASRGVELARGLAVAWRHLSPPTLFVGSFALLIGIATAGLLLLPGLYTGEPLRFVDALFTSTSAVCVTGLIVVDTATYFTIWGQLWVLLFIQLGGLGLITLTTVIIAALGRRLSLRSEVLIVPPGDGHAGRRSDIAAVAVAAAKFSLAAEAVGALVLWPLFLSEGGPLEAAWHAAFHAVSALCNAGFSTFTTSLVAHAERPGVPLVISALIVLGGLGYLTTEELFRWWRARKQSAPRRLSSHSFAVVVTSLALLAFGTLLFAVFEWRGVLRGFGVVDKVVNAWFMAVTPRTAGFNTVSYGDLTNASAFLTVLLMLVGGSPGSMAGGFKTTTLAILVALAMARTRARRHVELHGRTLPEGTVERTVSLVLVGSAVVMAAVFLMNVSGAAGADLASHRAAVLPLIFEVVSAFSTVGLSMDVTPTLGVFAKLLLTVLMFLGRVGPLVFFAALSFKASTAPRGMRAAREDVIVG
jgi:trk system potassium uptake protein